MRHDDDTVAGQVHVRLNGVRTGVDGGAHGIEAVFGPRRPEAAVGDGLRQETPGVSGGGDGGRKRRVREVVKEGIGIIHDIFVAVMVGKENETLGCRSKDSWAGIIRIRQSVPWPPGDKRSRNPHQLRPRVRAAFLQLFSPSQSSLPCTSDSVSARPGTAV